METKHCGRCERTLPTVNFSKHRSRPDGLQAYCKDCYRTANQRRDQANKARPAIEMPADKRCAACGLRQPASAFYIDKRRKDGLYSNCRTCHRKITDGWRANHPEAAKAIGRASYRRNAEQRQGAQRAYHQANRDARLAYLRQYKRENPERMAALENIRRARIAGAVGHATPDQIALRVAYYGGKCWICGAPWQQIDHVKPVARGGPNWPANLRPACQPCNSRKNDTWPLAV